MRQLLVLTFLFFTAYFAWSYIPSKDRSAVKRFLSKHLPVVGFVITTILVVLVVQFNNNSLQLL